jgi:hypothetical protein
VRAFARALAVRGARARGATRDVCVVGVVGIEARSDASRVAHRDATATRATRATRVGARSPRARARREDGGRTPRGG